MLNQEQIDALQKANMYDTLAQFYKYTNPDQHIKYYKKHIHYLQIAIQVEEKKRIQIPFVHTRFINLLPCDINVLLNDTIILEKVPSNGLSEYFILPTNVHQLEVLRSESSESPIISQKLEIKETDYSTHVITESDVILYPTEQYIPENETKLRVIHLLDNGPTFDVRVKKGDAVFSNVSYGAASDYLGLTPMTVDLELTIAKSKNLLLPLSKIKLNANTIYTLIVTGDVRKQEGIQTLLIKD
jgi:hypothetical protein